MLIMVAAMSRRMSGHSQLLTLGDYTQISRYFLESYVGDVMQQMRYASNNPKSTFSKEICDSISDADTSKKLSISFYNASDQLITLAHELEIDISKSKPTLEIINTEPLNYPAGIDAGAQNGKEKKGLLQLTCECVFRKREYKLTVQYPFIVVFRVTPVLKEFMLFVDNMAKEQATNDTINILKIGKDKIAETQDLGQRSGNYDIKPFVLLQPLDQKYDAKETSGRIYLGPSDRAIYINLAGGSSDCSVNETFLVWEKDIGQDTEATLSDVPVFKRRDGSDISLPGSVIPLMYDDTANMGVMGFGEDFSEVFEETAWKPEHFLGEGDDASTYWGSMKKKYGNEAAKAMNYASALKLYGLNVGDKITTARSIYGNVFARFMLLTFWNPYSGQGTPLVYDPHLTIDQVPEARDYRNGVRKFVPQDNLGYQFFQSRIMSGFNWETQKNNLSQYKYFMPLNVADNSHDIYSEADFTAPDGFSLDGSLKFHDFGKTWFRVSKNSSEEQSPIEQRIGRAFTSQEEFEEAVGYPKKFKVNGIVYVKGNLNLGDMNLSPDDCSGGVVLVDGNITLGNIYRGKKINASSFLLKDHSAEDCFKHWNDPAHEDYIAQDKMLTFVSLNGNIITLNGNVLLGVQLITLADHNGSGDQISWKAKDGIIFYGSIACSRLNLTKRVQEFYEAKVHDEILDAPFFMYPPEMATSTTSLAVQIMENMRGYKLNTGKVFD